MTDLHSHILPGIDDGSSCLEESLDLLRMEAEQGISRVTATPHFYARYESPDGFLAKREKAEEVLRSAMAQESGLPEVQVGAEVYYFRGISESEFLPWMTIGGSNCVLVEMPPSPWEESMFRELLKIRERRDLIPVIAHIDRYIRPFHTFRIPERLADLPVLVQANAAFFLERPTAGLAMKLLKRGQIHLIGSDCHNLTSRKPNVGPALKRIRQKLGDGVLEQMSNYESIIFDI